MTRIQEFVNDLREADLNDYDIAAGLGNGDIKRPDWLSIAESDDHVKVWDQETGSAQMGFYRFDY